MPRSPLRIACVLASLLEIQCAACVDSGAEKKPRLEGLVGGFGHHFGLTESAVYPRATISFTNYDSTTVEITSYRVLWNEGAKQVAPHDLLLQPGEHRSVDVIFYPGETGGDGAPSEKDWALQWTATRHGSESVQGTRRLQGS